MSKVVIHVRGGVAEVAASPDNVEVVIIDWDNLNDFGEDKMFCAACGIESEEVDSNDICPDCGGVDENEIY